MPKDICKHTNFTLLAFYFDVYFIRSVTKFSRTPSFGTKIDTILGRRGKGGRLGGDPRAPPPVWNSAMHSYTGFFLCGKVINWYWTSAQTTPTHYVFNICLRGGKPFDVVLIPLCTLCPLGCLHVAQLHPPSAIADSTPRYAPLITSIHVCIPYRRAIYPAFHIDIIDVLYCRVVARFVPAWCCLQSDCQADKRGDGSERRWLGSTCI